MEARKVILFRIYISFFLVCLFGLAIVFQIIRIQFTQGQYWKEKAEKMMLKYFDIDAKRGNIYSADGSLLSLSVPIYDVHFDARRTTVPDELFNDSIDAVAYGLAQIFGDKTPQEFRQEL
ncbi:MAG: cell division protein, partial [Bacteroidota bacterium]